MSRHESRPATKKKPPKKAGPPDANEAAYSVVQQIILRTERPAPPKK